MRQIGLDTGLLKKVKWLQLFATLSGSLCKMTLGIMVAWPSPSAPKLTNLTAHQIFMVISWFNVGQILAIPLVTITVDRIGRKNGILWCTLPIALSWLCMGLTQSYYVICFARLMGGLGSGYGKTIISMYAAEISKASSRGIMGTVTSFMTRFGMLICYAVGPYVTISTMALISLSLPILMLSTFVWMPKSPYFLLLQGKPEEAKRSLIRLRGPNHNSTQEFEEIESHIAKRESFITILKKLISTEANKRALIIVIIINCVEQFSGMSAIMSYSQIIFENAGSSVSPAVCSLITVLVQNITLAFIIPIVDLFNRKTLLQISSVGTGLSMGTIGVYFYIDFHGIYDCAEFNHVPLAALIAYHIFSMIGISTLPTIIQNEIFSCEVKSVAIAVGSMIALPIGVLVTMIFTIFHDMNLMYLSFGFFSICCLGNIILTRVFLPETRGLSLEEIQILLESKCKVKKLDAGCNKPAAAILHI